ncbi:hypothetical protein NPIL_595721 [Nephila pilipes]|uniref:Uncharacterized protein n=1 Tax=Nephila pilipes TaxID=299642 RepID=A0A8X6Q5Q2_NEPPI|nr:hypothetical protein NPIL_595721 [Nephila pilipes]
MGIIYGNEQLRCAHGNLWARNYTLPKNYKSLGPKFCPPSTMEESETTLIPQENWSICILYTTPPVEIHRLPVWVVLFRALLHIEGGMEEKLDL